MNAPCSLRTLNECPEPCADRCAVQPEKTPARAPIEFSNRDKLAVIAFGVVMALLAAGTMHALNHMEKQYQLEARV